MARWRRLELLPVWNNSVTAVVAINELIPIGTHL